MSKKIDSGNEVYRGHRVEWRVYASYRDVRRYQKRTVVVDTSVSDIYRHRDGERLDKSSLIPFYEPSVRSLDTHVSDALAHVRTKIDKYEEAKERAQQ